MGFDPMCVTTKRILKKLGGDEIPGMVLTFDGNIDGKTTHSLYGFVGVRVSSTPIDVTTIKRMEIVEEGEHYAIDLPNDEYSVITTDGVTTLVRNGTPYIASLSTDAELGGEVWEKGTYLFGNDKQMIEYTAKVEILETIHPIDPKFLPNDTIDLDEFGIGEVLVRLLAQGGGNDIIQRLGDDSFWEKFMELKPNYVSLLFQGIPTKCAIATQMLGNGMEFFGFKAFMPSSSDSSIVEATAIISHWVQPGETAQDTRYNITVTVQI